MHQSDRAVSEIGLKHALMQFECYYSVSFSVTEYNEAESFAIYISGKNYGS